jgi:hypothetical protein
MKTLSRLIPNRVIERTSMQILRARLAVDARQKRTTVGPGVPIVGEIALGNANWRRDVTLLLWTIAQEAIAADDRMAWLICVGLQSEEPLEDLYALAVQAEPIVQLHVMREQADADEFGRRFVPIASRAEAQRRVEPDISHVFAEMLIKPSAFGRATSVRAAAHTLVKQLAMGQLAIAVDAGQIDTIVGVRRQSGSQSSPVRFLMTGDPSRADPALVLAGNVIAVRRLGLSFLDELALIRVCDGYVGTCDQSAVIAADAGVPCLLASDVTAEYGDRIRCVFDIGEVSRAWIHAIEQRAANPSPSIAIRRTAS